MRKLFGIITALFTLLLTFFLFSPQAALAADVRTGNDVIITQNQTNLKDLYLFGRTIDLSAPVTNDVTAAGGNINISGSTSNNLTAAGGTVIISGKVGNTARVAGGNVTIDGPVSNDLVVAGGTVTINKNAVVGGDLLVAGGQVTVEGPVKGKILMSGGDITLNSAVGGNISGGHIGTFTLGPEAKINDSLTYSSTQPLTKDPGSVVKGSINYHQIEKQQPQNQFAQVFWSVAFYKLFANIIVCLLFIYFFRRGILTVFERMEESPLKNSGIGLIYLIVTPIVGAICLFLIWLGMVFLLSYGLAIIAGVFLADVYIGWFILRWWDRRNKKTYILDWKAAIVGPISLFILILIPVLGWLVFAIIFLIALGALIKEIFIPLQWLQGNTKKGRLN